MTWGRNDRNSKKMCHTDHTRKKRKRNNKRTDLKEKNNLIKDTKKKYSSGKQCTNAGIGALQLMVLKVIFSYVAESCYGANSTASSY